MADHEQEMEKIERRLNLLETRIARLESEMVNGESKDNGRPEVQVTLTETHSLSDTTFVMLPLVVATAYGSIYYYLSF